MLEKFSQSSGTILVNTAIGKITREDYSNLTAEVEDLLQQESSICFLVGPGRIRGRKGQSLGYRPPVPATVVVQPSQIPQARLTL
jgi:hypothetical protein